MKRQRLSDDPLHAVAGIERAVRILKDRLDITSVRFLLRTTK
jgi:hypothetical protein